MGRLSKISREVSLEMSHLMMKKDLVQLREEDFEEVDEETMKIKDKTEVNLVSLRRTVYLTIMSRVDLEEAGHKLLKINSSLVGRCTRKTLISSYQPFCMIKHKDCSWRVILTIGGKQRDALCDQFHLEQGCMSVDEYDAEFSRLNRFAHALIQPELEMARRFHFHNGLNFDFQRYASSQSRVSRTTFLVEARTQESDDDDDDDDDDESLVLDSCCHCSRSTSK